MLIYLSNEVSPQKVHFIIFLPLFIPLCVVLNIILILIFSLSFRRNFLKAIAFALLFLFAGYKYAGRTYQWNRAEISDDSLKILSYNVRVFNLGQPSESQSRESAIDWIQKTDARIVCVQEYYSNDRIKEFHTEKIFSKTFPFRYIAPYYDIPPQKIGLAILSKNKIVRSGEIAFNSSTFNQAIFADILLNKGNIVRIYNLHLQSMNIDKNFFSEIPVEKNLLVTTLNKYRSGTLERSEQLKQVLKHIASSPYPVIVCGDFNDIPYSYVYEQFRKYLMNGFEEKGNGFGFTYSGNYSFLRIDNIFASRQIKFLDFKTHNSVMESDHFPISATVRIEN